MLLEVRDLSKKMKNRKNINSGSFMGEGEEKRVFLVNFSLIVDELLERTKELDVMVAEINGTIE